MMLTTGKRRGDLVKAILLVVGLVFVTLFGEQIIIHTTRHLWQNGISICSRVVSKNRTLEVGRSNQVDDDDDDDVMIEYRPCRACAAARKGNSWCRDMILGHGIVSHDNATRLRELMVLDACPSCHPQVCEVVPFSRLRPDDAAPVLQRAVTYTVLPCMVVNNTSMNETSVEQQQYSIYNPSIVVLPEMTKKPLDAESLVSTPVYLASFRVSTVGPCGSGVPRNLVGVAVLDDSLTILRDVVIDANQEELWRNFQGSNKERFEDARLFVLNDTLFLSHASTLLPIEVVSASNNNMSSESFALRNLFGSGLRVLIPPQFPSRSLQLDPPPRGKNFQYFSASDKLWIEQWPIPHAYGQVDFVNNQSMGVRLVNTDVNKQNLPVPSFVEQDWFTPLGAKVSMDRGSACCIELEPEYHPHGDAPLMVGISHVKNKQKIPGTGFLYLSRLYAFEPTPPFSLVARSGLFCWGGDNAKLELLNGTAVYSCDKIHFVSGMVVKPNDPSTVVVAYGVNDCTSRLVEVLKSEIARHLFDPLDVIVPSSVTT